MTTIFFGSIGTLADTTELQREAFNRAFEKHGLDWRWEQDEYRELLQSSGGADRVAEYARTKGVEVDAAAIHRDKSELFQERLREGVPARDGVAETISAAKRDGAAVAFVTTTSPENTMALLDGIELDADFDLVVDATQVEASKPDAASYVLALERLGVEAGDVVAIEDNLGGVEAAKAAGVRVVAFPNENTVGHDFSGADAVVDRLDAEALR